VTLEELLARDEVVSALESDGTPFFIFDPARLRADYRALVAALPGVQPHYAVKALSHHAVLETLVDEGAGFDVATSAEIDAVLAAGATPDRIIHTHPHKRPRDIDYAISRGVRTFVADSDAELRKLQGRDVEVIARLSFPNEHALVDLSSKFGLELGEVEGYLEYALELGIRIIGFSYHVGSQNTSLDVFRDALANTLQLVDPARAAGHPITTVDIGGGFPVAYDTGVPAPGDIGAVLNPVMASRPDLRYISEPGRVLAAGCMHLVSGVVSTTHRPHDDTHWVYIDDGLFGGYSNVASDHVSPKIHAITPPGREIIPQTIGGPTCDSNDVIVRGLPLPRLEVGDLIVSPNMGAYSWVTASEFNGIPRTRVVVLGED